MLSKVNDEGPVMGGVSTGVADRQTKAFPMNVALPTAARSIPCAMKSKRNAAKIEARERQKKMRVLLAPLRAALDRAAH
jgi:capsule polysaccharide export protein KpsE/RkpR